jgi:hypothetical protein
LEATTSAARAAAVSPESAFDSEAETLTAPTRRGGHGSRLRPRECRCGPCPCPRPYRLMLVVSCSISSTVWMTLAFEE